MKKRKLYIVELLCVVLLFGAYLFNMQLIQEDDYALRIDDALSGCTISRAPKFPVHQQAATSKLYTFFSHGKSHGKGNTNLKHISLYVTMPIKRALPATDTYFEPVSYASLPENYEYLYFSEINPPPPKGAC